MRVTLVNYAYGSELQEPEALLDEYHTLTGWAEGLRDAGATVTVAQGFSRDVRLRRGGIDYQFYRGSFAPRLSRWRIPIRMNRAISGGAAAGDHPEIVHLNSFVYALQARHLRWLLPAGCALVAQHHAEKPSQGAVATLQRWGLGAVDGFFFTGREMARPWRDRRMIRSMQPVFEVMEGSSLFACADRDTARRRTGIKGRPVFLWAGNLIPGKDPLTVLDGFARLLTARPEARLYMVYRSSDLLAQVRERVDSSASLRSAVELLGWIPYKNMEDVFNSADFLLLGSTYEGSGYAVADALACGVVPIVTDIPSFRFMTGKGAVGALWPAGNPDALESALLAVMQRPIEPQRRKARALFEKNLSYKVIGKQAFAVYLELVRLRTPAPASPPCGPTAAALDGNQDRRADH